MYHLCQKYFLEKVDPVKVLHMAPERSMYELLKGHPLVDYTCIDINPERYPYAKGCLKQDALAMSFADGTFDVIISSHVIEHVPDAKAFIRESIRCLKRTGVFLLNFPVHAGKKSFEDPSIIDGEKRYDVFGQWDHVRVLGDDYLEYLADEFYTMTIIKGEEIVSSDAIKQSVLSSSGFVVVTPNSTL